VTQTHFSFSNLEYKQSGQYVQQKLCVYWYNQSCNAYDVYWLYTWGI